MASHAHHEPPSLGDIAYETFYSAAVGGLAVALFFLLIDLVRGDPLFTPTLLGTVIFMGGEPGTLGAGDMNLTAVALFTIVHLVGFGILGFIATFLVRFLEQKTGGGFVPPAIALFLVMEGAFLLFNEVVVPGTAPVIGHGKILMANVLGAVTMTWFLRHAHSTSESEADKRAAAAQGSAA